MFEYLIAFSIAFSSGGAVEIQKFYIWSGGAFSQDECAVKAKERADYIAAFTQAKIPGAHFKMTLECTPRRAALPVA